MECEWIDTARRRLITLAQDGAWSYRRGGPIATETTALAALGLVATAPASDPRTRGLAILAADRLADLQRPDGSLRVTAELDGPGWATPFAILLWRVLGIHPGACRDAMSWLLSEHVDTPPRSGGSTNITGHDTSIPGWPWVEGTHSWVEPSALAILSLGRSVGPRNPRLNAGLGLLEDRAIASGGWNYGNNVVFGRDLRPQPAPTGLALLALARGGRRSHVIPPALDYLTSALPTIRAASSLGWGLLGLGAWGILPPGGRDWLASSAAANSARDDAAQRLGVLLLASSPDPFLFND